MNPLASKLSSTVSRFAFGGFASALAVGCVTTHHVAPPVNTGLHGTALPIESPAVTASTSLNAAPSSGYVSTDGDLAIPLSDRVTLDGGMSFAAHPATQWQGLASGRAGARYQLSDGPRARWVVGGGGTLGMAADGELLWGPWASIGVAGKRPDVRPFLDLGAQVTVYDRYAASAGTLRGGFEMGKGPVAVQAWGGPTLHAGRVDSTTFVVPHALCATHDSVRLDPGLAFGVSGRFGGTRVR